jgi:Leucine-rich repeat (LRR) protein
MKKAKQERRSRSPKQLMSAILAAVMMMSVILSVPVEASSRVVDLSQQGITNERLAEMVADGTIPLDVVMLDLDLNQISDLAPLAGLTRLRELRLLGNRITDISPIGGLTNLENLNLAFNQIADISPLSALTRLSSLSLSSNIIADISPLSGLTNLTWLSLGRNQITDISPLSGLHHLGMLSLSHNQITDILPLSDLTLNGRLYLYNNQISDISPLVNKGVWRLHLNNNQISDLSPLENLTNLRELNLLNNPITLEQVVELQVALPNISDFSHNARPTPPEYKRGHVLGNDTIDYNDALAILRHIVGLPSVIEHGNRAWHAARAVTSRIYPGSEDALAILRREVGLPSELDVPHD